MKRAGTLDDSPPPRMLSQMAKHPRFHSKCRRVATATVPIRVKSAAMSDFSLETGEDIVRVTCECCGNEKKRVWGFVSKSGDAHAVYYALLNVTEDHPRIGLTLSIGPWWDGTEPSQRSWCHIDIGTQPDKYDFQIKDPKESNFYPWERGGKPLTPEQASAPNGRNPVNLKIHRPSRSGDFFLSGGKRGRYGWA